MNYYNHHIGDFKKDTSYLTHEQRSIYLEMLWLYYDQERGLEKDLVKLAMKVQATVQQVELLLSLYFDEEEKCYTHKRIEDELERTYAKSEKARTNALKRWGLDKEECDGNANAVLPNTQHPKPNTQNKYMSLEDQELCDKTFMEFWDIYPKCERKIRKKECALKWRKRGLFKIADKILDHLRKIKQSKSWIEGFIPGPVVYINQSRWEDEIINNKSDTEKMWSNAK